MGNKDHQHTTTPFIDASSRWRISLGALVAIVAMTAGGVAAWTLARADTRANTLDIATHEVAIKTMESRVRLLENDRVDLAVMKNDVKWIRQALELQQQRNKQP